MYTIFHPLDVDERLPRELVLEGRRYRWFELRHLEIFGFLYLPTVILLVVIVGSFSAALAFAVGGLSLAAVFAFVLSAKYR